MSTVRFGARDFSRSTDGVLTNRRRRKRLQDRRRHAELRAEGLECRRLLAVDVNQIDTTFPNGTYGVGTTIPIVVEFADTVTVTGPAWLYLNSGSGFDPATGIGSPNGVARWAYSSIDGRSHTFLYTVTAGDASPDLDVFGSNELFDTIVNGTFRDKTGVEFDPELPVAPSTTRLSFLKDIVIDTSAPVAPTVNPLRLNPTIAITDPQYLLAHPDYFTLSGTAGTSALPAGHVLTVTVNGGTYRPTVAADGTWRVDLQNDPVVAGVRNPWSSTDKQTYDVVATVTDAANNSSSDTRVNEITIDTVRPSIGGLSLAGATVAPKSYKVGDVIRFSVVFDEGMALGGGLTGTPANLPYILMTNGARATLASITGTRLNFEYTVRVGDAEKTNLDIATETEDRGIWLNGQRIQDLAGNQPTNLNTTGTALTIPDNLKLPTGITVDATLPTVATTRGLTVDGWYGPGQTIVLQVEFNEDVLVTGELELALNSGAAAKATMVPLAQPATPTKTLNFTYTVGTNDSTTSFNAPAGILAPRSTAALSIVGGGSVTDLAGNAANLTLPKTVIGNDLPAIGSKYSITSAPKVLAVTSTTPNNVVTPYTVGDVITIVVQFDRPIAVIPAPGTLPSLQLNTTGNPHAVYWTANPNAQNDLDNGRFVLTYTIAPGEQTPVNKDLDYVDTDSFNPGSYLITHGRYPIGTPATPTLVAGHVAAVLTLPTPGEGNTGSLDFNTNLRVGLDNLIPVAPTLALVDDTGLSDTDNVTRNQTVNVTGLETNSRWQYRVDGGAWSPVVLTAVATSFLLPEGLYAPGDVEVRQIDSSGNIGPAGVNGAEWNVDLTSPGPVAGTINDTNVVGDGITNNPVVTVTGVEAGAQVQFSTTGSTGTFDKIGVGSTFTLPVGTYDAGKVWVRQMDTAGNIGAAAPVNPTGPITVDTTAAALVPSLLNDTGVSTIDRITKDPALEPTFGGKLEAGATVEYYDAATTTWSPSYNPVEGLNNLLIRQVDLAGNISPQVTFKFTLDGTPPLALTVSLAADTGSSNTDLITSNPNLTLQNLEPGARLEYSVNGGAWSAGYAPTDGLVTVQVRQVDLVDNVSPASAPLTFRLDRAPPAAPTVTLAQDTGASGSDRITTNGALVPAGVEPGAKVLYSVNGRAYAEAYAPEEGLNTVLVKQVDEAGNETATPFTFTFTRDTTAPATPNVSLQTDTGTPGDRITSIGTLVVGNPEANAVVEYSIDNQGSWSRAFTPREGQNDVWVRQVDLAGNPSAVAALFTFTFDSVRPTVLAVSLTNDTNIAGDNITRDGTIGVLADETPVEVSYSVTNGVVWLVGQPTPIEGINNLLVRVTDRAGNSSNPSTPFSFTYDTVAPPAPLVALLNDTNLPGDNITTDPRLNVTGLVTGAKVEYSADNVAWSLVQPTASEGSNTVYVRQTDLAGNISPVASITFTLSVVLPPAVTVALQQDTGTVGDLITSNPTLAVSGVVAGGVVQYSTDGVNYGTGVTLRQGSNTVYVRQTNLAGLTSPATAFTFTYDSVQPSAPGPFLLNDTGIANDRITRDPGVGLNGVEDGARTEYSTNGGVTWGTSYSIAPGSNTLMARQIDVAGNTSAVGTISFVYDVTAPATPTVSLQQDTGSSSGDRITSNGGLAFSNLEANATIEYSTDGGTTWSGSFVPVEGVNTVAVRQKDVAGNVSSSSSITFTLDLTNPTVTNVTSPNADGTYTPGQTVQIVVTTSETVVLTAGTSATLALNTGRNAVLVTPAGTPTTSLTFNYTVQAGDTSGDLDYTSSTAMVVTAGSIRDVAGNNLVPTLPVPVAPAAFKALGAMTTGRSLGSNKNIVISSLLIATPRFGSASATLAPQVRSAVTSIPIRFNMPVSRVTLANIRLFVNNRAVSLKGATLTGSGTSWTLRLPSLATNLKGIYRLDILGVIASSGVGMGGKTSSTYWRRV